MTPKKKTKLLPMPGNPMMSEEAFKGMKALTGIGKGKTEVEQFELGEALSAALVSQTTMLRRGHLSILKHDDGQQSVSIKGLRFFPDGSLMAVTVYYTAVDRETVEHMIRVANDDAGYDDESVDDEGGE